MTRPKGAAPDVERPKSTGVVVSCRDLTAAVDFYSQALGFRLDAIFPADAPRVAVMSDPHVQLRLEAESGAPPAAESRSPVQRARDAVWSGGRAGMQYRDLIPDRVGGRWIASHIRIPLGGPVPDYVHHHHVRFQMIYCCAGWVKVVYEDQGPPFVLSAGDGVLQPPHIRHRVLECSDGMEVVEISSPAEHETLVDHDMELPTAAVRPDRDFSGQRFVRHQANAAAWRPGPFPGFEARDIGVGDASGGRAFARVIRPLGADSQAPIAPAGDLSFLFVLQGSARLQSNGAPALELEIGDAVTPASDTSLLLAACSGDLEFLHVTDGS